MYRGFTIQSSNGIATRLISPCHISPSSDPADEITESAKVEFRATFDTGATGSIASQRVVDNFKLKPVRKAFMEGVHGIQKTEVYLINLYLPNDIVFYQIPVLKGSPTKWDWDILVGMDVIGAGDLLIRNTGSSTEFTFRVPDHSHIEQPEPSKGAVNWLRGLLGSGTR